VLLAAVGGPKWDTTDPAKPRPEQGLLGLRKGLGLYANLRPVKPLPALYDSSPLRRERIEGTDLLVVRRADRRDLLRREDAQRRRPRRMCACTRPPRSSGSRAPGSAPRARRCRASTRPTCSRPRGSGARSSASCTRGEFPQIELEHVLVDNAAMQLISAPRHFDTILTENMSGTSSPTRRRC